MGKRYAIWNKKDNIITPVGEILTAEEWKDRYPVANLENVTIICSAGEINGGYFGTLGQMIQIYENRGLDFSDCKTDEDKLNKIENFEDELRNKAINEPTIEERTAAALEFIAMSSLPDETV